jgi:hypothetical protein
MQWRHAIEQVAQLGAILVVRHDLRRWNAQPQQDLASLCLGQAKQLRHLELPRWRRRGARWQFGHRRYRADGIDQAGAALLLRAAQWLRRLRQQLASLRLIQRVVALVCPLLH